MVEPLEETRNELIFATEPVLSSLHLSIPGSTQFTPLVELDEVEVSLRLNVREAGLEHSLYRSRKAYCSCAGVSPSCIHRHV